MNRTPADWMTSPGGDSLNRLPPPPGPPPTYGGPLGQTTPGRPLVSSGVAGRARRGASQAAPFHLPNGRVGLGRTFPPQMNAWIRGRRLTASSSPRVITMPRSDWRGFRTASCMAGFMNSSLWVSRESFRRAEKTRPISMDSGTIHAEVPPWASHREKPAFPGCSGHATEAGGAPDGASRGNPCGCDTADVSSSVDTRSLSAPARAPGSGWSRERAGWDGRDPGAPGSSPRPPRAGGG